MKPAKIDAYPELKDTLAELTADNVSQAKIAEALGVKDRGTVAEWQKRPDIRVKVTAIIQERSNSILSQTTKRIKAMLDSDKKISLENLLKIHREFAGANVNLTVGTDDATALQELFQAADTDPNIAAALASIVPEGADAPADEED